MVPRTTRRSSRNWDSGPRLTKLSAQGGRGRQGELAGTLGAAGEGPTRHAPWPVAMELAGAPRSARRSAPFREKNRRGGSRRGGELTSAKNGGREGSNRRDGVRRSRWSLAAVSASAARERE